MIKKFLKIFILSSILTTSLFSISTLAAFSTFTQMLYNIQDKELSSNMKILQSLYDTLTSEEKESIESMKKITESLSNGETDTLFDYIDEGNIETYKNNLNNFFDTYPKSKEAIREFFKRAEYKILSMKESNGKITSKVEITIVDLKALATKIAPGFLAKNFLKLMKGKDAIDNELINSLLESMKNGLGKDNTKTTFEYNIEMRKTSDTYKLSNANQIARDIENYVKSQISNFSKLG